MQPSNSWFGAVGVAVIVGLIAAMSPGMNGGSGSAAPVLVAEPRGAMAGTDSVLDRPLDVPNVVSVTNNNDAGAGLAAPGDRQRGGWGHCRVRRRVTGTITLTTGFLEINKNLTIQGPGANVLAVSGNNASKVFVIDAANTVSIPGLPCGIGTGALGSGIENHGNLTLTDVAVINNGVVGTGGGGIYNQR